MNTPLKIIAQSLGIQALAPREWIPGWGDARNHLLELLVLIAGTSQWPPLLRIHVPLVFVLSDAAERAGQDGAEVARFALRVFQFLATEHRRNNRRKWPGQSRSPRYAFLMEAHESKPQPIDSSLDHSLLCPTFRSIAYESIQGLIDLEKKAELQLNGKSPIPDSCGWAARLLIRHAPEIADSSLEQIGAQVIDAITAFEARHREWALLNSYDERHGAEKTSALREGFVRRNLHALEVLVTRDIRVRERKKALQSRAQARWRKDQDKYLVHSSPTGSIRRVSTPPSSWQIKRSMSLGISPGEFDQLLVEGVHQHERPGSMWAKLTRSALLYKHEEAVAWSRDLPTLTDLARCYRTWFNIRWDRMTPRRQLSVFKAMMYLHHGLLPEMLTPIRVGVRNKGRKLLHEHGIYLDCERLAITTLLPLELEPEFLLAGRTWRDLGLVEVHLNPLLAGMLKGLLTRFRPGKSRQRWIPASFTARRLDLPAGVTMIKLSRCFESYYCQRHGLEPELASMVAGRPVLGRNSSIHYFRSTSERLHREHWQAFERFHHEIISVCGDPDLPSRLPQPATTPEPSSRPVGSLFYPSKSELTAYLAALRDRLDHLRRFREYRAWREVLCLYVYECLRLVTGMRVIDKPMFNAFALMGEGRWLRLQEKGPNPRVVPVHPVVADLVRKLANENAWLQGRLWSHGPRYNRPLFFIERGRKTELLSNLVIGDVCQRHGIARPEIRPNAHRHLMRSQIHDCGLSHQIADFVLGHTHYGPHVQDQLSLVPMEQLRRQFMPVADSLVSELGIQTVRAWS